MNSGIDKQHLPEQAPVLASFAAATCNTSRDENLHPGSAADKNHSQESTIALQATSHREVSNENVELDPNLNKFFDFHKKFKNVQFDKLSQIPEYNWEILSDAFDYIYTAYAEEMSQISKEFERLELVC